MVSMEESPWCFTYEEPHWEHECQRQREEEYSVSIGRLKCIDTTYTLEDEKYIDITEEQLEEVREQVAWQAQLEILSQMDEPLKERLRKKDMLTYSRTNKFPSSLSLTTKVVPPPPTPPFHDLLPQPIPTNEDHVLNIDVPNMIGKMNIMVLMVNMCKIPSIRK
jgi:hypothetical protein